MTASVELPPPRPASPPDGSGYWVIWPFWSMTVTVTVSIAGLPVELLPASVVGLALVASSTKVNGKVPEVPAGVLTATETGPAGCAGVLNVNEGDW